MSLLETNHLIEEHRRGAGVLIRDAGSHRFIVSWRLTAIADRTTECAHGAHIACDKPRSQGCRRCSRWIDRVERRDERAVIAAFEQRLDRGAGGSAERQGGL